MDVNILLFPEFETLDAFGPIEMLGQIEQYRLRYVSLAGGIIASSQGLPVLTESIDAVDPSGILLLPGGMGTRALVQNAGFIAKLAEIAARSEYCLSVCTGAALLAKTGLLDNRKATSNKMAFAWVKSINARVLWVDRARWVVDGKYYTSSGVSAGMDMTLGFVADRFGSEKAREIAEAVEYVWNADPEHDPFAGEA